MTMKMAFIHFTGSWGRNNGLRSEQSVTSETDTGSLWRPVQVYDEGSPRETLDTPCTCDTLQGHVTCYKSQHLTVSGQTRAE